MRRDSKRGLGLSKMFTSERLREIVVAHIGRNERLGYQAGGSGHLGYVSFEVDEIGEPTRIDSGDEARSALKK